MDPVAAPGELRQLVDVPEEVRTEENDGGSTLDAVRGPDAVVDSLCATGDPLTIPLGSLLELKVNFLCVSSSTLEGLGTGSTEAGAQLSVRGRLHLSDGTSQKDVVSASLSLEPSHCTSERCSRQGRTCHASLRTKPRCCDECTASTAS